MLLPARLQLVSFPDRICICLLFVVAEINGPRTNVVYHGEYSSKVSAGVSGQGLIRTLHLLSRLSTSRDTSNYVFTQDKKRLPKLYNMVKQTNYNLTKRILGFTQNNRGHFRFTSNQSGFKKPVSC